MRIGLISDTHGLLRPEAVDALRGSDVIVHAGDVGKQEILAELARLAPVTAVRGNIDTAPWAQSLPQTETLAAGGAMLYVLHSIADLDRDPAASGFRAVISGHSHKPSVAWSNGVLYVNPGSAGPRRFSLPISVANLFAEGGTVRAELVEVRVRG